MAFLKAIILGGSGLVLGGTVVGVGVNQHLTSRRITSATEDLTVRGGHLEQQLQEKTKEVDRLKEEVERRKGELLSEKEQQAGELTTLEQQLEVLRQQKSELENAKTQIQNLLNSKDNLDALNRQYEEQEKLISTLKAGLEADLKEKTQVEGAKRDLGQELQQFKDFEELYSRLFGKVPSKEAINALKRDEDAILGSGQFKKTVVTRLRRSFFDTLDAFISDLKNGRYLKVGVKEGDEQKFIKQLEEKKAEWMKDSK
ncbi:hypothetical protein OVS_03815 [Mycoplasma ovis str. Michigan]|uniref:Chromosome partition protein Smc n=1 Tax=Mycoplasma ovis str. Michigan TaxID=1415773 RepID=A0ABN4BRL4_9MOLU|nr:hypothetical protein [Mycoplasma ovis]AHC40495.1 hypothetical protein OVS_03815 [Mycoplasma ovis str. Michigan]